MARERRGRPFSRHPQFNITLRLTLELRERVELLARKAGLRRSEWLRRAVERAVLEAEMQRGEGEPSEP